LASDPLSTTTATNLEFHFENRHFHDPLPLQQPDSPIATSSDKELTGTFEAPRFPDESSVASTLSAFSDDTEDTGPPQAPPTQPGLLTAPPQDDPTPLRARAHPSRLNNEWQTFFRDSLIADDPANQQARPQALPSSTPTSLPPPLRPPPNEPCGDNFEATQAGAFRVWSVNANGISSKDGFAELHTLCVSLKSRSVDAIAIQEPNTDFMKADIREQYTKIFKEHFGQACVLPATSCIDSPRAWKPGGGVVLAIVGLWAQHVSKVSRDDLGSGYPPHSPAPTETASVYSVSTMWWTSNHKTRDR
jgi:hypothetical protein